MNTDHDRFLEAVDCAMIEEIDPYEKDGDVRVLVKALLPYPRASLGRMTKAELSNLRNRIKKHLGSNDRFVFKSIKIDFIYGDNTVAISACFVAKNPLRTLNSHPFGGERRKKIDEITAFCEEPRAKKRRWNNIELGCDIATGCIGCLPIALIAIVFFFLPWDLDVQMGGDEMLFCRLMESARKDIAEQGAMRLPAEAFDEFARLLDEPVNLVFAEFQEGTMQRD